MGEYLIRVIIVIGFTGDPVCIGKSCPISFTLPEKSARLRT